MKKSVLSLLVSMSLALGAAGAGAEPKPHLAIWDDVAVLSDVNLKSVVDVNAPQGGTIRYGAYGTFDNFNPFAKRGRSAAQIGLTYQSLGESVGDDTYVVRGVLAKTFDLADDRKSLVVTLHEKAAFSDGTPVSADDVVFSFEALTQHATPVYKSYYQDVEKAEALDAKTVRFVFKNNTNRELPLIVAQMSVFSKAWWTGKDIGQPQTEPILGSGPFVLDTYKMGQRVVYKKNPNWWAKDLEINKGRYNWDTIQVDYFRDVTVAREAFFSGETDLFAESSIKDWIQAYDVPSVRSGEVVKGEFPFHKIFGMSGLFMNTRHPQLTDIRVRQALAMLFDFEWTNRALFHGAYTRCDSFFSGSAFAAGKASLTEDELKLLENLPGINPADYKEAAPLPVNDGSGNIRPRLREAMALLKEAGYTLKDGKMVNAQGQGLNFKILMSSQSTQRIYAAWIKNLARIGITVTTELVDQTQYVSRVRSYDYDLIHATQRQSNNPGNGLRYMWGSAARDTPGARNYIGVASPAVDALIEKVANPTSAQDLKTSVRVLDRVLMNGWYVIPGWYSPTQKVAWRATHITPPKQALEENRSIDMRTWHRADVKAN